MSRYLLGTILGLIVLFTFASAGSLLRISRGNTTIEDDDQRVATSSNSVDNDLSDLEGAGQLIIRQTSDEALSQVATQPQTPAPAPTQAPATSTQSQAAEPATQPSPQNNREAIPALW